jgi:hypothetical protein
VEMGKEASSIELLGFACMRQLESWSCTLPNSTRLLTLHTCLLRRFGQIFSGRDLSIRHDGIASLRMESILPLGQRRKFPPTAVESELPIRDTATRRPQSVHVTCFCETFRLYLLKDSRHIEGPALAYWRHS